MKIDELYLTSFGKFKNKKIEFGDGINIVYGLNESGKTTIHSFIDGMFYGFLRPYVTRAYYKEEHEKYEPWSSSDYRGSISLRDQGKNYIIERVFIKGKEDTKVFISETGEDISQDISALSSTRILQPGNYFFGFNDVVFSNTISIGQMANQTEEDLAREVKDKLANITTSLDEDVSVKSALAYLSDMEKKIGSSRAKTSVFGNNIVKIRDLNSKIKKSEKRKEEYEASLEKIIVIEDDLDILKLELEENLLLYKKIDYRNKFNKYRQALELKKYIENSKEEIKILEKYKDSSMKDYTDLLNSINKLERCQEEIGLVRSNIEDIAREISKSRKLDKKDTSTYYNFLEEYKEYKALGEEIKEIEYRDKEDTLKILKVDYSTNLEKIKVYRFLTIIGIALVGASLVLSIFNSKFIYLLFNIVSIPLILYSKSNIDKLEGLVRRIESYIEDTIVGEEEQKIEIERLKEKQALILSKYDIEDRLDFDEKYNKVQLDKLKKEEAMDYLKTLEKKQAKLSESLLKLGRDKYNIENKIEDILLNSKFEDLEDFKLGLEKKSKYEEVYNDYRNKEEKLKNILSGETIEELKRYLKSNKKYDTVNDLGHLNKSEIDRKIKELKEEINLLSLEQAKLGERIKAYNRYNKELRNFKEELFRREQYKKELELKLKSINLAKTNIESLSKRIHREFAPTINKTVGEIISKLTSNKYEDLKIDDDLNIKVVDPTTKELIEIDSLSGGTIDQLYFALRLGVIETTEEKKIPLILDDCFTQYDDKRLENILIYLSEIGEDRQIILFTCQRREMEILNKNKINYNLIEI